MVFVCHVTFQDHVVKALIDVLVRSSSKSVPSKFGGHEHYGSEDIIVLVSHVILQNHDRRMSR